MLLLLSVLFFLGIGDSGGEGVLLCGFFRVPSLSTIPNGAETKHKDMYCAHIFLMFVYMLICHSIALHAQSVLHFQPASGNEKEEDTY